MRRGRATTLLIALALGASGCAPSLGVTATRSRPAAPTTAREPGSSGSTSSLPPGESTLDWGSCARYEDVFLMTDMLGLDRDGLDCATLTVPLDYSDPSKGTIDLAVGMVPARNQDERIGSLFINPGGPGGSGLEYLPQFVSTAADDLLDQFDIVSWDPRGVSASTPITCLTTDEHEASANEDPTPDSDAELEASLALAAQQNADCVAKYPDLVPRMGTQNVARDLDRLREAVGDDTLTYLGFSYGTLIGGAYAELFPDNVRALVLDGSLLPESSLEELRDGQFGGFVNAFDHFVQGCESDSSCPLDDARAAVEELVAKAAVDPIPTLEPGRPLTEGRAYTAIAASLYDAESWSFVYDAIESALDGNAGVLGFLADLYVGRRPDGTWTNSDESFNSVSCADYTERPTRDEIEARAQEILQEDPFWGPLFAYSPLMCEGAAPAMDAVAWPITGDGAPPIIVVGTTGDPATPYQWAQAMAASLQSGVLITFEGDGHTAYGTSKCASEIVDRYLLELVVPTADQVCTD